MPLSEFNINSMSDIFVARMFARRLAQQLGFAPVDQARISLATSELGHLLVADQYFCGHVQIATKKEGMQTGLQITCHIIPKGNIIDGPCWLSNCSNHYQEHGLDGVRRLVDESNISEHDDGQTEITLIKWHH